MNNVIYVGHCLHTGSDIDYKFALELDARFHSLPNLYGISVTKVDGANREVTATLLVKTNMGQTKDEVSRIYSAMVHGVPELSGLPLEQITLRCTRTNLEPGLVPTEKNLLQIFIGIYTLNSRGGVA